MSFEKLSADCLTLVFQHIDINTVQELPLTSKSLRSICLAVQFTKPIVMPISKVKFPEILMKLTTIIQADESIEKTGTDWLPRVLCHFSKVKVVDVVTKDLSRKSIRDILSICEASETVTTVLVRNLEVTKWIRRAKTPLKTITVKPRWLLVS